MPESNQHSTPERNRVAREGAEWIDKMATVQSLASQREPFENMAAAVRSLANDYESLVEQLEAAHRELRFALMVEPEDHRAQWTEKRTCAYVTPDCLWCSIRRVLASNPAHSPEHYCIGPDCPDCFPASSPRDQRIEAFDREFVPGCDTEGL